MSNNNKTKFMETFSTHITNINRVLKNIKSEVMVDFILLELKTVNSNYFSFSFLFLFSIFFSFIFHFET